MTIRVPTTSVCLATLATTPETTRQVKDEFRTPLEVGLAPASGLSKVGDSKKRLGEVELPAKAASSVPIIDDTAVRPLVSRSLHALCSALASLRSAGGLKTEHLQALGEAIASFVQPSVQRYREILEGLVAGWNRDEKKRIGELIASAPDSYFADDLCEKAEKGLKETCRRNHRPLEDWQSLLTQVERLRGLVERTLGLREAVGKASLADGSNALSLVDGGLRKAQLERHLLHNLARGEDTSASSRAPRLARQIVELREVQRRLTLVLCQTRQTSYVEQLARVPPANSEILERWSIATDALGSAPANRSRFFVMGLDQDPDRWVLRGLNALQAALLGIDVAEAFWTNYLKEPERLGEKPVHAFSYIGPMARSTFQAAGLIVEVPRENILFTSPTDYGGPTYGTVAAAGLEGEPQRALDPDALLDATQRYNEVTVRGTHPKTGAQVRAVGVFLACHSSGEPLVSDDEVARWEAYAKAQGWPPPERIHRLGIGEAVDLSQSRRDWELGKSLLEQLETLPGTDGAEWEKHLVNVMLGRKAGEQIKLNVPLEDIFASINREANARATASRLLRLCSMVPCSRPQGHYRLELGPKPEDLEHRPSSIRSRQPATKL